MDYCIHNILEVWGEESAAAVVVADRVHCHSIVDVVVASDSNIDREVGMVAFVAVAAVEWRRTYLSGAVDIVVVLEQTLVAVVVTSTLMALVAAAVVVAAVERMVMTMTMTMTMLLVLLNLVLLLLLLLLLLLQYDYIPHQDHYHHH
jgi:hypothetical protein